mmetsp:Transcript_12633/g.18115  ORF Transcript_12633/g.18115 Transcript_12633/m.18115 type:complete len:125 (+) Transcript_12633:807-1181(+)
MNLSTLIFLLRLYRLSFRGRGGSVKVLQLQWKSSNTSTSRVAPQPHCGGQLAQIVGRNENVIAFVHQRKLSCCALHLERRTESREMNQEVHNNNMEMELEDVFIGGGVSIIMEGSIAIAVVTIV